MSEQAKPLQAQFDPDEIDVEVVEGIGFEPGIRYRFVLEKPPVGKYMQYGAAKGGLYVLSKKCPAELSEQYNKHPDQFEIFTNGEINGQQALVPGRDFDKFKPFLSRMLDVAWVHETDSGGKRLVFMSLNASDKISVNPGHPEWESPVVRLARKLGYVPPEPKSSEKFSFSFLHPGVAITAEVEMVTRKGDTKARPMIVVDTIEVEAAGKGQEQKTLKVDIDPEIRAVVTDLATGCSSVVEVIKKVKAYLKEQELSKDEMATALGQYSEAITKMKASGEILK